MKNTDRTFVLCAVKGFQTVQIWLFILELTRGKNLSCVSSVIERLRNLNRHLMSHTGEKPYVCFCDKAFGSRSALVIHTRKHTGEKPFVCSLCGKAFCDKSTLSRHIASHTGEKPFVCSLCDKSFVSMSQLKLHVKKEHSVETHFVHRW